MTKMRVNSQVVRRLRSERLLVVFSVLAWTFVTAVCLHAQVVKPDATEAPSGVRSTNAPAQLPETSEETDRALSQIEAKLAEVRVRAAAAAPEATPDERTEQQRLFQQWALALDSQSRNLRRLKEVRRLNQERANEAQAWRGFIEKPPYPLTLVEGLRDAIAAQRLEEQTERVMLSISESGVARGATQLEESRKQARLARDQAEAAEVPDQRRQWLLQLTELRAQSSEATVEASEKGRLVTLETLSGLRKYIEFLDRKLAAAQAQARFTKADLDGVIAQLNEKREALRRELSSAIPNDAELRRSLATARENLRLAELDSAHTPAQRLRELRAVMEAGEARAETSGLRVDLLRTFLVLADRNQATWEDRFWATGDRTLTELRNKRQSHAESIEGLRPWRRFAQLKLSNAAQASGESISMSGTNLASVERESARQIQTALQERVSLYQRALTALAQVENLSERLAADLQEREAHMSSAGKAQFVIEGFGAFCRRIWNTELYIAEASVIADGQKISVPRIITLGKVVIALGIFLAGVLIARWGGAAMKQTASIWFKAEERTAGTAAKVAGGTVALIALFVAMASVRIPWTIFAFMGGALAIGVGFGAQTLINNFISGVILLFERSIRVGDIVGVGDQQGKVVSVGFRNSLIRRSDGVDVLVPNSKFLESEVVNWTLTDNLVRYKIIVGVAYGSSPKTVSSLIARAAAEHGDVVKTPAPQVLLEDFGDNALIFALVFWMELQPRTDGGVVRSELRHRIHALLDEAGIILAFPQRDVHLDSAHPLEVRLINPSATDSSGERSSADERRS